MLKNRLYVAAVFFLISFTGTLPEAVNVLSKLGWSRANATVIAIRSIENKSSGFDFQLIYRYKTENVSHVARSMFKSLNAKEVESLKSKYPKGKTIAVVFNPNAPRVSEPKSRDNILDLVFPVAIPVVFLVCALKTAQLGYKKSRD